MNVKLIRLQTGEDLIAEVTETSESGQCSAIKVKNPCMVFIRPNSAGTGASIGLTRWLPYAAEKDIEIDKKWIVVYTDPADDLKNEYNQAFGSGIVVAPAGLKVN